MVMCLIPATPKKGNRSSCSMLADGFSSRSRLTGGRSCSGLDVRGIRAVALVLTREGAGEGAFVGSDTGTTDRPRSASTIAGFVESGEGKGEGVVVEPETRTRSSTIVAVIRTWPAGSGDGADFLASGCEATSSSAGAKGGRWSEPVRNAAPNMARTISTLSPTIRNLVKLGFLSFRPQFGQRTLRGPRQRYQITASLCTRD